MNPPPPVIATVAEATVTDSGSINVSVGAMATAAPWLLVWRSRRG